jgi:hypothetical protein
MNPITLSAFVGYFVVAFLQAIVLVRVMNEKCAPGLMLFLATLFAPLVTFGFILAFLNKGVNFLLNVGRKSEDRIEL